MRKFIYESGIRTVVRWPQAPCDLGEKGRVSTPVPHEPTERIGGVDGEIARVFWPPTFHPRARRRAQAIADLAGSDHPDRVAAPQLELEQYREFVEQRVRAGVNLHIVAAAVGQRAHRHQPRREAAAQLCLGQRGRAGRARRAISPRSRARRTGTLS